MGKSPAERLAYAEKTIEMLLSAIEAHVCFQELWKRGADEEQLTEAHRWAMKLTTAALSR